MKRFLETFIPHLLPRSPIANRLATVQRAERLSRQTNMRAQHNSLLPGSCQVAGVRVDLFEHAAEHGTPDAVFPNNWFSTHPACEAGPGGVREPTLVLYPMKCPNRCWARHGASLRTRLAAGGAGVALGLQGQPRVLVQDCHPGESEPVRRGVQQMAW